MKYALALVFMLCVTPAWAATYHAGSDCAPLAPHTPLPDVETRPGVNHRGEPVVPADINGAAVMDMQALKNPTIALDIPVSGYVDTSKYNADLSRSDINVGQMKITEQGDISHNNQILSTGQQPVYKAGCTQ